MTLVFAFVIAVFLAAVGTVLAPRIWSGRYVPPQRLFETFLPTPLARGTIRALPLNPICLWLAAASLAADGFRTVEQSRPATTLSSALLAVAVLVVMVTIVLFNRPKALVPPHMRSEPGAIGEWLSSRG